MMRVFVYEHLTGAGSAEAGTELFGAGLAMRDAVVQDLLAAGDLMVSVAAGHRAPAVPAGASPVQAQAGTSAVDFVADQARLHDRVWVIAPETDGVLGRLQRAVGAERWLGCAADAIALASSKRATLVRAAQHGVLTPLEFASSRASRRWVVKPDDGAGAVATRVHDTLAAAHDDAESRRRRGESATLEAWVAGEPLSLSLLCSADRTELLSVNRQQLVVHADGELSFAGVHIAALPRDDARFATLNAWAQTLVGAIAGLCGFVGVDLVWHPQRGPVLIEINPRVTMAYVGLSAAIGCNLAQAVLGAHEREPVRAAA